MHQVPPTLAPVRDPGWSQVAISPGVDAAQLTFVGGTLRQGSWQHQGEPAPQYAGILVHK
jgi:hypothetical protein